MHIYGARAHFAYLGRPLGDQFLCIFMVLALTLPAQVDLWESSSIYIYLRCSRTSGRAVFMHIYSVRAYFAYLG